MKIAGLANFCGVCAVDNPKDCTKLVQWRGASTLGRAGLLGCVDPLQGFRQTHTVNVIFMDDVGRSGAEKEYAARPGHLAADHNDGAIVSGPAQKRD